MAPVSRTLSVLAVPVGATLLLFVAALVLRPLIPVGETRYLTVAWEMRLQGDWLAPLTLNFEPYHLTFADTGCGIAPELHRKVFEAFGQGRHDLAEKDRGTGLGLAIVKGLVELHGGTLTLESDVGKGAAFTICIPPERVVPVEAFKAAA